MIVLIQDSWSLQNCVAASPALEPNMCRLLYFNTFDNHRKMNGPSAFHSSLTRRVAPGRRALGVCFPSVVPSPGLSPLRLPLYIPLVMSDEETGLSATIKMGGAQETQKLNSMEN